MVESVCNLADRQLSTMPGLLEAVGLTTTLEVATQASPAAHGSGLLDLPAKP